MLEPVLQVDSAAANADDTLLYIKNGQAAATGKVTSEGFVVLKGAAINEKNSTTLSAGIIKLREKYRKEGKVKNLVTTEDILFSSSSAAAEFVLGYNISGPRAWKTKDGRTLREIEDN